jgi:hypothetical protein
MPPANPLGFPSLVLSLLILSAAVFLEIRLRIDRRRREAAPSRADTEYYARQDVRRRRGILLMALIGLACSVGFWINPRAGRDEARLVFATWVVIGALLVIMLGLALLDWAATFAYARRQRRQLAQEREALINAYRPPPSQAHPPSGNGPPA